MLETAIADGALLGLEDELVVDFAELGCLSVDGGEVEVRWDLERMVLLGFKVCLLFVESGGLGLGLG